MRGDLRDPQVRAVVLGRLESLGPDSVRSWGTMSPHQAICHLADSFDWAAGRRPIRATAKIRIPAAVMRVIALRLPVPWPKGVPTMPEVDQRKGGTPPGDFDADRARLAALVEEFARAPAGERRPPHPIFHEMSQADWGRWAYRHMDHHLRQFGH